MVVKRRRRRNWKIKMGVGRLMRRGRWRRKRRWGRWRGGRGSDFGGRG